MTALERLRLAAGPGGTTGDALKRMGRGAGLAGALLVAYSGLASATAAQHLLHVVADQPQQVYGSGAQRRDESDETLRLLVEAKWEAIEQARLRNRPAQSADTPPTGPELPISAPDASLDALDYPPVRMAMPGPLAAIVRAPALAEAALPLASAQTSTEAVPQADDGALQRKRAQQRAALLLLIDELM